MRFSAALIAIACSQYIHTVAMAEERALDPISGDGRAAMEARGITLDLVYKLDFMANVDGGIHKGSSGLDNLDVIAGFDSEKLFGLKGSSALIHLLNNNGGEPDANLVGSAQGINNIEVSKATGKLYQAWLQQNFFDDRLSFLGGLYDLNSEFYVTDSSLLFIHPNYGIGADMSQSGLNGPSIFPTTSLAGRVKIQPAANLYLQAAILDGAPGAPDDLKGTQIEFNDGEGALFTAEAGVTPEGAKIAIGAWTYSDKFPDHLALNSSGNLRNKRSRGLYIISERKLFHEEGGNDQGLSIFARIGWANGDVNRFGASWSTGLVYTGLIPTRDAGQFGLGVSGAHNSGKFKRASRAAATPVKDAETAIELTYSDTLTPWLSVQPDIQYIVNPGTDPALDDALIIGGRLTIVF